MKRLIFIAVLLGMSAPTLAQVGLSWQIQVPELAAPGRGSLAGQLSGVAFGPADVSRGGFSLASPYTAPVDRGPLLAKVFPAYSPEAGISEWGLGWQTQLALTRWRVSGDLDYQTDDLTGVFGHCQKGGDGYWYPVGLAQAVRIQEVTDGFVAYMPDGSVWRFGQSARIQTPSGTYAWMLREVESAVGQKTKLTYEANRSGRLFLTRVEYGGRGDDFQYRIDISYSTLTQHFVDYRSGFPLRLDRRVAEVAVYAKNNSTGEMALRWKHRPTYLPDPLGPAFFLSVVQQVFASGDSPPPFTFQYGLATSTLQSAQLQPASKFDPVIADFGGSIAFPDRSSTLDARMDGLIDLEDAFDNTLIRQTVDGYVYEPLQTPVDGARLECRAPPSIGNRPRTLAQIRPSDAEYSVVSLQYRQPTLDTALVLCTREGVAQYEAAFFGDWTLTPNVRLVDLNRDHQPDLIQVYEGGYQVIPNLSTPEAYAFGAPIEGRLDLSFPFQGFWVHDFNGDAIPDIVIRTGSLIAVYFGKGNFTFEAEPQLFPVENQFGEQFDLNGFQFTWLDANGDGLTDLLLSLPTGAYLFTNTGARLRETPVPVLSAPGNISFPLFNDFVGSGDAEVFVIQQDRGYSVALNEPGTSLLQSANDGRGTILRFRYARSPAVDGVRQRHALLDTLTVESSGHDVVSYRYSYEAPTLHTLGQFLLGYGRVGRQGAGTTQAMDFFNSDTTAGLLLASNQHDDNSPLVDAFETRQYDDVTSFGIPWKRLRTQLSGWKTVDDSETISERMDNPEYEAEICPKKVLHHNRHGTLLTEKTRASVSSLSRHLHCLEEQIVLTGTHEDTSYNFVYKGHLERNSVGLVTKVQSIAGPETLTLQEVFYNPDYTIDHISSPGRGSTFFGYQPATRLLQQVTAPERTVVQVTERDPVTDGIRALHTDRGASSFTGYFRYDGQERLAKSWDDLGGASERNPNHGFSYRYATPSTPASVFLSTLVDSKSGIIRDSVEFATAAGESFTTARHIPEGWVFDGLIERNVSRGESKTHLRPTLAPDIDILALDYPALFAGAQPIVGSRASGFGHEVESRTKFHSDVEKQVSVSLELAEGELTQTALENQTFRTIRHLDVGKRVLAFEDEAATRYGYRYDAMGRLRDVSLPDGKHHRVAFDAHGRVRRLDREGVASIEYTYDGTTGLLMQKRFFSLAGLPMRQVAFQYDNIGRKSVETHTDLVTRESQSFRYYYDGATPENPTAQTDRGLLTAVTGDGYVKRFKYRPDSSLSRRSVSLLGWRTVETQFAYYEDGTPKENQTTVKDDSGQPLSSSVQQYARDNYGRWSAVSLDGQPFVTLRYDVNGQLNAADFVSGGSFKADSVSFGYDPLTRRFIRMSELSANAKWNASNSQRMNARGLVDRETISVNELNLDRVYGYSPPGFLTSSVDAQTAYTYEFDSFGLPKAIEQNEERRPLVAMGDTLTAGDIVYRFDGLGRTIEKADLRFTYGPSGHIARAQRGGSEWSFLYDENGQRLAKRSSDDFVAGYFDEGYLDSSGLTEPFQVAAVIVGIIQSGAFRLLPADVRGTVTADADGTARIASPFGDRAVHPDVSAAIDYVKKGFDADLGVVRMGVRDYDPQINRFFSPDPLLLEKPEHCLKDSINCNLYTYARNSPVNYADPEGRWPLLITAYTPPLEDRLKLANEIDAKLDNVTRDSPRLAWLLGDIKGLTQILRLGEGTAALTDKNLSWSDRAHGIIRDMYRTVQLISLIGIIAGLGRSSTHVGEGPAPKISLGEIKPEAAYRPGLKQLASRGDVAGNTALTTYTNTGEVNMQVFAKDAAGIRQIIWEGNIGRVQPLPEGVPGTGPFGNRMEPLVRELVGKATEQKFAPKAGYDKGPDLVPIP